MTSKEEKIIRVGSRKSELALIQTKHVISRLQKLFPTKKFEIHTMSTIGDRVLNISLPKIGEKSLFTRDLEEALRSGGVDFVVHSLKDLPTALPTGMTIGAVLERDDARDALVLRENFKGHTIATLPPGSVIGTSSLRRTAQIKRLYPHLIVCDIRGNLNTRLAKLDAVDSKFAGIILAQAGLVRMGWEQRVSQVLEPTDLLYAVGQGALAVECRSNDQDILSMLQSLMCFPTMCRILAERSFLKTLGGGCSAPVAVWSNLNGDVLNSNNDSDLLLVGAVWSLDGETEIRDKMGCSMGSNARKRSVVDTNNTNGNGTDHANENEDSQEEPPEKRACTSNSNSPTQRRSPPVINDDADVEGLSISYDIKELIEKHMDLAKKCPVIGHDNVDNGNLSMANRGGGDAAILDTHCPLPIEVGQDFMGQCPFVSNETKVNLANAGKCPLTKDDATMSINNNLDEAQPSTSKCPFSSMHQLNNGNSSTKTPSAGQTALPTAGVESAHGKCPFLQKTVQMFDYDKEEKPKPNQFPVLIEDFEHIFCGLYQHTCYNRDFYVQSEKLGRELAQELIKKGALDVMKVAQAEIHGNMKTI